ncbi:hypothetical protein RNM58_002606 [Escherichia coli]|nr:hypothetical protein [Escherichia coli]ELF8308356.1 hypothetical protein [Escherichia coli]
MQFKDLPEDIQKVAADALKAHLSVVDLRKEPKTNLENISRNLRDIFVGLYAYDNEKHKDHFQNCCLNKGQQNIKHNITENDKSINSAEMLNNSQKTDPLVFWNTVQAFALSKVFELNNIKHSGIDTHQSSHREGVSILMAVLREQVESPQSTSNDTEQ